MAASNSLDFDCDWRFGFVPHALGKARVGYLTFWSGCAGLNLPKALEVYKPVDSPNQTLFRGPTMRCVGVMESFRYRGGPEDPIRITAYVNKEAAANIRAKLASPLANTRVKLAWYSLAYDEDSKGWFEGSYVKDQKKAEADLDMDQGRVQMFIANEGTRIGETIDLRVYRFEFQVIPATGKKVNLEFASGLTEHVVKQWGA